MSAKRKNKALRTLLSGEVDAETFASNYKVVRLALHGFSTKAIGKEADMTTGQVTSRIRLYGLQGTRARFRDGLSKESGIVRTIAMDVMVRDREAECKKLSAVRDKVLKELREIQHKKE